jgi:PIN domain nuclease of toxin-antitoxin system
VKLLIDTQCWLWWFTDPTRLNRAAHQLIAEPENTVYLSSASSWEIAIKSSLGKLKLPESPERYVPARLASQGMPGLSIEHVHALRVFSLPPHHRDPFDRLIVAQAQVEGLPVLTSDPNIALYDVEATWGGQGPSPW